MILPNNSFLEDTKTNTTMSYLMDVEDTAESSIEQFLKEYTSKIDPNMAYESKETHKKEFEQFRIMFLIIGNALSLIVGIIGILNYMNVILTGIITRKREFSVLKSIGMTGKQLVRMLMIEGSIYAGLTLILSAAISSLLNVTLIKSIGGGLWFFTARFTLLPIIIVTPILLLFSVAIPYFSYHVTNKQSIVDQLREQ
jgi:putative ABC transport system permease protein